MEGNERGGGQERRREDRDHDTLTRIDENLSNFMRRFADHTEDDKEKFGKLDTRTERLEKWIYIGLGAIGLLEFLLKK